MLWTFWSAFCRTNSPTVHSPFYCNHRLNASRFIHRCQINDHYTVDTWALSTAPLGACGVCSVQLPDLVRLKQCIFRFSVPPGHAKMGTNVPRPTTLIPFLIVMYTVCLLGKYHNNR